MAEVLLTRQEQLHAGDAVALERLAEFRIKGRGLANANPPHGCLSLIGCRTERRLDGTARPRSLGCGSHVGLRVVVPQGDLARFFQIVGSCKIWRAWRPFQLRTRNPLTTRLFRSVCTRWASPQATRTPHRPERRFGGGARGVRGGRASLLSDLLAHLGLGQKRRGYHLNRAPSHHGRGLCFAGPVSLPRSGQWHKALHAQPPEAASAWSTAGLRRGKAAR